MATKRTSSRATVTFPDNLWHRLSINAQRYGFRSTAKILVPIVRICCDLMDKNYKDEMPAGNTHDEIERIFSEFSSWEPTPDGTIPKKPHPRFSSLDDFDKHEFYVSKGYIASKFKYQSGYNASGLIEGDSCTDDDAVDEEPIGSFADDESSFMELSSDSEWDC